MASLYKRHSDRKKKGSKWIIRWFDAESGKWRDRTGYSDKEASLELGRSLERESGRRAEGIIDPFDEHLKTALAVFVGEWADGLRCARGSQMRMHVERIVSGTGCDRLHRLDAPAVQTFLAKLKADEKWSDTTYNEYIASIRSFTRWAVTNRRLSSDPLVGLARIGAKHVKAK